MTLDECAAGIFDLCRRDHNTDEIKALISAYEAAKPAAAYHVPGPYEIALAVGASLAASGTYDTPGAALQAAWGAVPEFYFGRDFYLTQLAPMVFGQSPPEGAANGAAA